MEVSFIGANIDIINECVKVKKLNRKALKNAIYSYNNKILTEILEKSDLKISSKAAIKALNQEAMLMAIKYNFDDFILYLASFPFQNYSIPLLKVYIEGNEEVKKDIDKLQPIFLSSIVNNRIELCKFLLSLNVNVNYDKFEDQPLQYAAIYNRKEIAEILISHGADVNQKNEHGWTPLQRSAYFNNIEIKKYYFHTIVKLIWKITMDSQHCIMQSEMISLIS
ncbi:ankyrin repeat protein, putative [Trichomonas vaginalis G3]|uniref:Ankyrin repeat protein, putative n=1 Tax=Trichomonas vaginalis (strain ATCC PRA-98 / G3) TaxID=412133 RepID=A2GG88_TRIV3|nr:Ankyrin repeat family [Trichomonas vaginalis G3]EAX83829.1 ankyrin repeat protein, putative [Trichomonas vaginalis G3]KAI5537025.1 Ankyrin repeat family [Trichomonas vaginalis G3]|eukprot:XP_001296759.1 ankyrin repeat protein [Trichomonas vaginalis G3]